MNCSELSDAQISQRVGAIISRDQQSMIGVNGKAFIHHYGAPVGDYGSLCLGWVEFDPCNSWSDAGPIIAENQISLVFDADLMIEPPAHWVMCRHVNNNGDVAEHYAQPNKPLRAAMIVFLMMQESQCSN